MKYLWEGCLVVVLGVCDRLNIKEYIRSSKVDLDFL